MISNDVNVIFAYLDSCNKFHLKASLFVKKNKRRNYINLSTVNNTFIRSYSDYIRDVGIIIERTISGYREKRQSDKRLSELNGIALVQIIEPLIKAELVKLSEATSYTYDGLNSFKDLLLIEFSIPELYFESDKIGEFREVFIQKSRELAVSKMNLFLSNFIDKQLMKLDQYSKYEFFLNKLTDLKDFEDRHVCAELFAHGTEKGQIHFLTFDGNFVSYLLRHAKANNVKLISM